MSCVQIELTIHYIFSPSGWLSIPPYPINTLVNPSLDKKGVGLATV